MQFNNLEAYYQGKLPQSYMKDFKMILANIQNTLITVKPVLDRLIIDGDFYICGSALISEVPQDYDLFFQRRPAINHTGIWSNIKYFSNCTTIVLDGVKTQLIDTVFSSSEELINHVDFTHCQAVAVLDSQTLEVKDVLTTVDFHIALHEGTSYIPNRRAFQALLRTYKYRERGLLVGQKFNDSLTQILVEIIKSLLEAGEFIIPEEIQFWHYEDEELDTKNIEKLVDSFWVFIDNYGEQRYHESTKS